MVAGAGGFMVRRRSLLAGNPGHITARPGRPMTGHIRHHPPRRPPGAPWLRSPAGGTESASVERLLTGGPRRPYEHCAVPRTLAYPRTHSPSGGRAERRGRRVTEVERPPAPGGIPAARNCRVTCATPADGLAKWRPGPAPGPRLGRARRRADVRQNRTNHRVPPGISPAALVFRRPSDGKPARRGEAGKSHRHERAAAGCPRLGMPLSPQPGSGPAGARHCREKPLSCQERPAQPL